MITQGTHKLKLSEVEALEIDSIPIEDSVNVKGYNYGERTSTIC